MKPVFAQGSLVLAAVSALLAGCGMSRNDQLEAVARDWCMTIRASQIIPVYPLTEDVQPGDIYLVQVPVDQQQSLYKRRGFLALDNHLARLHPTGYAAFYDHSFLADEADRDKGLPAQWVRPDGDRKYWEPAPNAAFPSYSFATSNGAGFNLALPISGVPVGLSLMGAQSANGSITIGKTHTLGVDITSLHQQLRQWARDHREDLVPYSPAKGDRPSNYLRVITRVYATGRVNIALSDARTVSGGADVGLARPVDLINAKAPTSLDGTSDSTIDNYNRNLANLNAGLAESLRPTRVSGSNAGLSVEEINAKTEASRKASEDYRKKAQEEAAAKKKDLEDATESAAPKLEAEAEARRNFEEKLKAAQEAQASEEDAQKALERTQAAHEAAVRDHGESSQEARDAQSELDAAESTRRERSTASDAAKEELAAAKSTLNDAQAEAKAEHTRLATARGNLDAANAAVGTMAQIVPGGSLRVTAASSRFITMREDFDPPLVIGYLGFDVEIREGGEIGPPIPTHAQLDPAEAGHANAPSEPSDVLTGYRAEIIDLREAIDARPDSAAIYSASASRLGADWSTVYSAMRAGQPTMTAGETFGDLQLAYQSVEGTTKADRQRAIRDALQASIKAADEKAAGGAGQ